MEDFAMQYADEIIAVFLIILSCPVLLWGAKEFFYFIGRFFIKKLSPEHQLQIFLDLYFFLGEKFFSQICNHFGIEESDGRHILALSACSVGE